MRRGLLAAVLFTIGCSGGAGLGGAEAPYPPCGNGCVGATQCDPASYRCVPRYCSATGCAAGFYCDHNYDFCTTRPSCLSDLQCPAGWACHEATNECAPLGPAGCLSHADCPAGERCDLVEHVCGVRVPCSYAGCGAGWGCNAGYCEPVEPGGCFADYDCAAGALCLDGLCAGCATDAAVCSGAFAACDASRNSCTRCLTAADCSGGAVCDSYAGCVECQGNADCGSARPVCSANRCVECLQDADCPAGEACDAVKHVCRPPTEDCLSDAWCPADRPRCDSWGDRRCYECVSDSHCAADQRCEAGYCRALRAGETCALAVPLEIPAGHLVVTADLGPYRCDSARCLSTTHADAYWSFTLSAPAIVQISSGDPNYPPAAVEFLGAGCAQSLAYHAFSGADVRFAATLPAGSVVMRVEGSDISWQRYWIVLRTSPAP